MISFWKQTRVVAIWTLVTCNCYKEIIMYNRTDCTTTQYSSYFAGKFCTLAFFLLIVKQQNSFHYYKYVPGHFISKYKGQNRTLFTLAPRNNDLGKYNFYKQLLCCWDLFYVIKRVKVSRIWHQDSCDPHQRSILSLSFNIPFLM